MNHGADSLLGRALAMLRSRPGKGICAKCLADALGSSPKNVQSTLQKIEQHPGLTRGFGQCAMCGKDRLVLKAN